MSISAHLTVVQLGFRLPRVSFQLIGGTCEAFSVQNYLSKVDKVLSESLGTYYFMQTNHNSDLKNGMLSVETCDPASIVVEFKVTYTCLVQVLEYSQTDVKNCASIAQCFVWILACMHKPYC